MDITSATKTFIQEFIKSSQEKETLAPGTDKSLSVAVIYERFRTALDYQEENWVFKNAIARILSRQYTIFGGSPEKLFLNLVDELSWANYLDSEKIDGEIKSRAVAVLDRYLAILKAANKEHLPGIKVQKTLFDWAACELVEVFSSDKTADILIDFAYRAMQESIDQSLINVSPEEGEILLKLEIYNALFKADYATAQHWLLRHYNPDWEREEPESAGRHFKKYYQFTEKYLNHPQRRKYFFAVKKMIAPFILINNLSTAGNLEAEKLYELKSFKRALMDLYEKMIAKTRRQISQAVIRALIFVFLSKILLALLLELPFEKFVYGRIDYLSLGINILLPIALMSFSVALIKTPGQKNNANLSEALESLYENGTVGVKKIVLKEKESVSCLEVIFNFIYALFSLAILTAAAYILARIGFNPLNIGLFFLFVSVVSFLAFRIRLYAKELEMASLREDLAVSFFDFITIPFVRIGKYMSDMLKQTNPFIMTIDFLIEAPLKTILKIVSSWFRFVKKKKEEIEF